MSEYVVFTEEFLHSFCDPATCSYMVPLSGKAAHDMKMLRDENATLKAENAKLRELVRDMHKALFSLNLDHCQACPREDACVFMHKSFDCDECAFERDMHELGVEVNDG